MEVFYNFSHGPFTSSGGDVSFIRAPKNWQASVYSVSTPGVLVSSSKGLIMDLRVCLTARPGTAP